MFEWLDRAKSYPLVLPNGSKIVTCGTADVPLTKGIKSPNYSLYEVTDNGQPCKTELNSTPTIVFEYGYTVQVWQSGWFNGVGESNMGALGGGWG
jgi:hypothetical protein